MLTKQRIESALKTFVDDTLSSVNIPSQSNDRQFLEIAVLENITKVADARVKGITKELVKAGLLRDIKKDKCTEDTVLYDGACVRVHVELGTPRDMFDKEAMKTDLQLRGVSGAVIAAAMEKATKKTAASQSVKYDFK